MESGIVPPSTKKNTFFTQTGKRIPQCCTDQTNPKGYCRNQDAIALKAPDGVNECYVDIAATTVYW
jgi:hypothetical protein